MVNTNLKREENVFMEYNLELERPIYPQPGTSLTRLPTTGMTGGKLYGSSLGIQSEPSAQRLSPLATSSSVTLYN